jgi:predicted DNA-binding transcriptional regulator AlpA
MSAPDEAVGGTVGKGSRNYLDPFRRTTPRRVTTELTGAISPKSPVSDLLGVDLDPENSLIASCIRELCLRIGMVSSITGLSVPTIYREIAQDRFPRPIKITVGARAWKLSEIMGWIETRERDRGPTSTTTRTE